MITFGSIKNCISGFVNLPGVNLPAIHVNPQLSANFFAGFQPYCLAETTKTSFGSYSLRKLAASVIFSEVLFTLSIRNPSSLTLYT